MNQERRYLPLYAPQGHAEFLDGESFVTRIWLTAQATPQVTPQADTERVMNIAEFCRIPRSRDEIQQVLGLRDRKHFREVILESLLQAEVIEPTLPEKPTSPNQRYVTRQVQP